MPTKPKSPPKSPPNPLEKPLGSVQLFTQAAECLKTLAHPVRLRMVQLLLHGKFTVGQLAEDCNVPDNVASEHLRLMQRCGFLSSDRHGRQVFYRVSEPHLASILSCVEARFINKSQKAKPRRRDDDQ